MGCVAKSYAIIYLRDNKKDPVVRGQLYSGKYLIIYAKIKSKHFIRKQDAKVVAIPLRLWGVPPPQNNQGLHFYSLNFYLVQMGSIHITEDGLCLQNMQQGESNY